VTLRAPAAFVAEEPGLYMIHATVIQGLTAGGTYRGNVGSLVRVDDEETRLLRSDLFVFTVTGQMESEPSEPGAKWRVEYAGEAVAFMTAAKPSA
jgi:hypothetical protein